jgi:hypothetical protein
MGHVINIHSSGQKIDLAIGKYKIDVLGGWGVRLGQFSISLIHDRSGEIVVCDRPLLSVQSFAFDKRAKRIFVASILAEGIYRIEFRNPKTIKIKPTNLFFSSIFQSTLPTETISIYIY